MVRAATVAPLLVLATEMRCRPLDGLTELWNDARDQRLRYSVGSPVRVLDALLRDRRRWEISRSSPRFLPRLHKVGLEQRGLPRLFQPQ